MKKTIRSCICLVTALILLLSLSVPALAKRPEQPFTYLTTLGDSIGYHVAGGRSYVHNEAGFLRYTYPCMVFEDLGLEQGYYGNRCGWRAVEALVALEPDYYGDDYTKNFLINWGGFNVDMIKAMSAEYTEGIKKADLIILNFGSNDLLGTFSYVAQKMMIDKTAGTSLERATLRAIEKARAMDDMWEAVDYLLEFTESNLTEFVRVETLVKDLLAAMAKFPGTWAKLIEKIRSLNPDAMIAAVSVYNPYALSDAQSLISEAMIDTLNTEMRTLANLTGDYVFVDLGRPDLTGSRDGSHLGDPGHREVADKILAAVMSKLPCDHSDTVVKNAVSAGWWHLGYTGDVVCADCGKVMQCGEVVSAHLSPFKTPSIIAKLRTVNQNALRHLLSILDAWMPC